MRKTKLDNIRNMALRRGLSINKARRGGWYIMLYGSSLGILYCTHSWDKVVKFVKQIPILVKQHERENSKPVSRRSASAD